MTLKIFSFALIFSLSLAILPKNVMASPNFDPSVDTTRIELVKLLTRLSPFFWYPMGLKKGGIKIPYSAFCLADNQMTPNIQKAIFVYNTNISSLMNIWAQRKEIPYGEGRNSLAFVFKDALDYLSKNISAAVRRSSTEVKMSISDCRAEIAEVNKRILIIRQKYPLSGDNLILANLIEETSSYKNERLVTSYEVKPLKLDSLRWLENDIDQEIASFTWFEKQISQKDEYANIMKIKEELATFWRKLPKFDYDKFYAVSFKGAVPLDPNWDGQWHKVEIFRATIN